MIIKTTLVRTRTGKTYHRRECGHARGAIPWRWAEGRTRAEVEYYTRRTGLRACRVCDPLGALPLYEE